MKKLVLYVLMNVCMLITVCSCSNNEDVAQMESRGLKVSTEELVLTNDNGTALAGTIEIMADVPEAELEWITSRTCRLNNQLKKLYLENGKATLPVEWLKPFDNGETELAGLSFVAGVRIKAGNETKYVSLIWGGNATKISPEERKAFTRATNDTKISSLSVTPQQVKMNSQVGGAAVVTLNNIQYATVDYSGITQNMNIDLSSLPVVLTATTPLVFSWKGSAPTESFNTIVTINAIGVPSVTLELVYDASETPGPGPNPDENLNVSTVVPGGNIPDEGGTYYCNFTGTYTGMVLYRATVDGVEVNRVGGNVPSLLSVTIPELSGKTSAEIRFEYSTDGGTTWKLIETRTQLQETLSVYPIQPAGNIPAAGGTVACGVYGTYSKRIAIHARVDGVVIASSSGTVPSTISLQIPAYRGNSARLIIFEYSKNGGPWLTLEVKRQLGS